mmetsp:Transcript_15911/g.32616  ORF Transcript_15911/g.32616 Transcript_15911/m.32616 type:complete len:230 (-) Transcript_15911:756-1445(-)
MAAFIRASMESSSKGYSGSSSFSLACFTRLLISSSIKAFRFSVVNSDCSSGKTPIESSSESSTVSAFFGSSDRAAGSSGSPETSSSVRPVGGVVEGSASSKATLGSFGSSSSTTTGSGSSAFLSVSATGAVSVGAPASSEVDASSVAGTAVSSGAETTSRAFASIALSSASRFSTSFIRSRRLFSVFWFLATASSSKRWSSCNFASVNFMDWVLFSSSASRVSTSFILF